MNLQSSISTSRRWFAGYIDAWDSFWFTPRLPQTLAVLRIITGLMLLYSHLVLATDLSSFLGDHAWVNNETVRQLHDGAFGFSDLGRSYLWYISNPLLLWLHHALTLLVTASLAVGFMTRITAPAAWLLQLMYLHRLTGTLFGLDQIISYSAMYLMLSPCGSCFSVDAWLRKRLAERRAQSKPLRWLLPDPTPSIAANIATRLFQLHLCVIYLFGGLAKARGETWWDGTAMWYSIANYEYQSMDMIWIGDYPRLFTAMTHVTLFWEIFYCALVWPRMTRPIAIGLAVVVHGGIALFMGMITFGSMMIAANMIFLRPETLLRWIGRADTQPEIDSSSDRDQESSQEPVREAEGMATDQEVPADDQGVGEEAWDVEFGGSSLELGLEEFSQDSNASDILRRALDPDSSASGILGNMAAREASLARREQRLRDASLALKEKKQRLNDRLDTFNERVARLKERESKIQRLVDLKRTAKGADADKNHENPNDEQA